MTISSELEILKATVVQVYAEAQFNLAKYDQGNSIQKDGKAVARWFRMPAEQ